MSLKSSEGKDSSRIISAILISPFCSSSCCHACFPSIVRPMNRLWELVLKIFFYSKEMNRSIFFSMYLLRMKKKMDYCLRNLVLGESVSLVQYQSNSFRPKEQFLMKSQQVLFFVVLLLLLLDSQIFCIQERLIFELIFRIFCVVVVRSPSQIYLIHEKF